MPENIFSSISHHGIPFSGGFGSQPQFLKIEEDEVVTGAE
jgi:hypothetical protein